VSFLASYFDRNRQVAFSVFLTLFFVIFISTVFSTSRQFGQKQNVRLFSRYEFECRKGGKNGVPSSACCEVRSVLAFYFLSEEAHVETGVDPRIQEPSSSASNNKQTPVGWEDFDEGGWVGGSCRADEKEMFLAQSEEWEGGGWVGGQPPRLGGRGSVVRITMVFFFFLLPPITTTRVRRVLGKILAPDVMLAS
jgi:hypothetical protein